MLRSLYTVLFLLFAVTTANAEYIYKDNMGRTLRMYYSWAVDANGLTKLNVQLVNYSSVTWIDIVVNCAVTNLGGTRAATKEIPLASPVFDFELSKEINGIDMGQMQPNAILNCSITQAGLGEPTLKSLPRMAPAR